MSGDYEGSPSTVTVSRLLYGEFSLNSEGDGDSTRELYELKELYKLNKLTTP